MFNGLKFKLKKEFLNKIPKRLHDFMVSWSSVQLRNSIISSDLLLYLGSAEILLISQYGKFPEF